MWAKLRNFFKFLRNYIAFTLFIVIIVAIVPYVWPKSIKEGTFLVLKFEDTDLHEIDHPNIFDFKTHVSVQRLRKVLDQAKDNPKITGIAIEMYATHIGYGHAQEIRRLLNNFKQAGKHVFVYTDTFGEMQNATSAYYLASIANEIWMQYMGVLNLNGLVAERYFAKSFLDKYNIKATVEKREQYKSAIEWAMRDNFSQEARENWEHILRDILNVVARDVALSRGLTDEHVQKCIDSAPLLAGHALTEKLIDKIGSRNEFYDYLEMHKNAKLLKFEKYPLKKQTKTKNKVAVVYLHGQIMRYDPENVVGNFSQTLVDRLAVKLINRAVKDGCKALVLRVDSPGGSAIASETIYQTLKWVKDTKKIPIIVSMGNFAASGGYLISLPCDKIIAEETTLTGSIGVYMMRLMTEGLWNDYGIHWDHISAGKNANFYLTSLEHNEEQRLKIKKGVDAIYESFLDKVKKNRALDKVRELAGGRVFTGRQVVGKLVDDIGGLEKALESAAAAMSVDRCDIYMSEYPRSDLAEVMSMLRDDGLSCHVVRHIMQTVQSQCKQYFTQKLNSAIDIK